MISSIEDLKTEEQQWLINAVINIVLSDGIIEQDQVDFVKKLSKVFLGEVEKKTLKKISESLREKRMPPIDQIEVRDIEHLIFMLDTITASVFANGKKLHEETTQYFEIGQKLGVNLGTLSYRLSLEAERFRVKRKLEIIKEEIRDELLRSFPLSPQS